MQIYYLLLVFTLLSAVASTIVLILLFALRKQIIVMNPKYVIVLQMLDLLADLSYIIPSLLGIPNDLCIIQAFVSEYFSLSEVLWTGVISLSLYYELKMRKGLNSFPFYKSLIAVLIFSLCISFIPVADDTYALENLWCTISPTSLKGKISAIFCYYFFLWVVVIWNLISYIQIINSLKSQFSDNDESRSMLRRLRLYFLGLPLFYLPLSIMRLFQVFGKTPDYWFVVFASCFSRSIGIYNSIAYGLNRHVLSAIRNKFLVRDLEPLNN